MSYVLDALRRADAERQQGRPPDLNAPGALRARAPAPQPAAARLARAWPLVLLLAGLAAALLWPRPAPDGRPDAPTDGVPLGLASPAALPPAHPVPGPTAGAAPVPPRPVLAPAPDARPAPRGLPAEPVALPLERLDPALRQALPPLAFSGAMDSPDPAARMLIVNGRLLREGDAIATDLVLERIALRSALLRWRGQRLEVRY